MRAILDRVVRLLSSYGLAVVVLILLMLLTFFGTLEQKHHSIYDVQRKYFESPFLVHWQPTGLGFAVPIPLPGALVLLGILFVNLVVGGLIRIRKRGATVPVIIGHIGILLLLTGGLVEHLFSTKGLVRAPRGVEVDEYESYFDWELVVVEHLREGGVREHLVPLARVEGEDPWRRTRFTSGALPFDLVLSGYLRNADLVPAGRGEGLDGFALVPLEPHPQQAEQNMPGFVLTVEVKGPGGRSHRAILHGAQEFPWQVAVESGSDARTFDFDVRKRRYPIPFGLRLDDFVLRYHPGTGDPQEYSSYVTKVEEGSERAIHITMNQPLRHRGFTFFQSSFGEKELKPDGNLTSRMSVFAVVENPADKVPLIACIVIGAGLLIHMARKFLLFARAERKRRPA
jgi:hypothetical protein